MTTAIEKMYQGLVHREYQRILWHASERVLTHQLRTINYGHTASPQCAIRALLQCAEDHQEQFQNEARFLKVCLYVDDLLTGADYLEGAEAIKNRVNIMKIRWIPTNNVENQVRSPRNMRSQVN